MRGRAAPWRERGGSEREHKEKRVNSTNIEFHSAIVFVTCMIISGVSVKLYLVFANRRF